MHESNSILKEEANRVCIYANDCFNRLKKDFEEKAYTKIHLNNLYSLIEKITDIIEKTIQKRIEAIMLFNDVRIVSKKIDDLRRIIRTLYFYLDSQVREAEIIPRNLYRLIDYYLEKCDCSIKYNVEFGECLAMRPFKDFIISLRLNRDYPELFKEIEKEEPFFTIIIPPEFKEESNALLWPLVMHEVSHAIDQKKNIVNNSIIRDGPWHYFEILLAAAEGNELCIKKLKTMELYADGLSTWLIGPYYPNVMLEKYFTSTSLLEVNISHPLLDDRILYLNKLLKHSGFNDFIPEIEVKLNYYFKDSEKSKDVIKPNSDQVIDYITNQYSYCNFNYKDFTEGYEKRFKNVNKDVLINDIIDLKPVLLDPSSMLTMICSIKDKKIGIKTNMLFSDCIKLFTIDEQYREKFKDN